MKKKINTSLKRIFSILLCITLLFSIGAMPQSRASELDDLREQYDRLTVQIEKSQKELENIAADKGEQKTKLATINAQISAINDQMDILQSRINLLGGQVSDLNTEISTLNDGIKKLNKQISDAQAEIEQRQVSIEETKALMIKRLREIYMAGGASKIEILLGADDLASYLTRTEMLKQVAEDDEALVEKLNAEMRDLADLKKSLSADKVELQASKEKVNTERAAVIEKQNDVKASANSLGSKQHLANSKYEQTKSIISKLDKSSAAYKEQIARFEREQEKTDKAIDEYIRTHGSNVGDETENDGKLSWPVPYDNCYISAGYPTYPSGGAHHGIDICVHGGSAGKKIVAAQSGEVISSGWNGSFGNAVIIDHGNGLTTLYGHCSSVVAHSGDKVQKGDLIAYIGSTGNSTGPHCHFEVRIKNGDSVKRVNPLNYVHLP